MFSKQKEQVFETYAPAERARKRGCTETLDKIPEDSSPFPYGFVANTDKDGERGTHWVAFFIPNSNSIEYFDSFAKVPLNKDHEQFLKQYKNIKINSTKLQSPFDTSCGSFAIYFLVKRCRGESFDSIVKSLANNHPYSDTMVKLFVFSLTTN